MTTPAELNRLLARTARGDEDAFARLYSATHLKLFGIVLRILRRRELAVEVLQEVYIRIWERAGDFEAGRASPITWLAVIARNRALDEARRRTPRTADEADAAEEVADGSPSALERMEMDDDLRRLEDCLGGLDGQRGTAVRLAYLQGLTRQELAERFGQPVGTIKSWLHRSLKQLKDCLES
ncbi:MAG: sigma-70 family RNA polymerase sigma factor [Pseudomonadota bacterium]|nr:sigma-70 family RNA polymerase sigma factor [Pseudomonadota bacterium]